MDENYLLLIAPVEAARALALLVQARFLGQWSRVEESFQELRSVQDFEASFHIREDIFQIIIQMAADDSQYVDENGRAKSKGEAGKDVRQVRCLR